jgi:hypothetical protein
MNESKVVSLRQKDEIDDPLTDILRSGAKRLVQQAVEAEFTAVLAAHAELELPDGRQRVVRHGHDPVRPIQPAIGRVFAMNARDEAAQHKHFFVLRRAIRLGVHFLSRGGRNLTLAAYNESGS